MRKECKNKQDIDMSLLGFKFSGYKSLEFHRELLQDSVRTRAFQKAIDKVVKKRDVVIDLGSGTGILSFFACKAGAKKVYAIEASDIFKVSEKIAQRNKMAQKIAFLNKNSRLIDLPEKADVIVSECLGYYALGGDMISATAHARDAFLKKDGTIMPQSVSLFLVPVESSSHYEYINFWKRKRLYGIDFSPAQVMANNNVYSTVMSTNNFISKPKSIARIDLQKDYPNEMLNIRVDFPVKKTCRLHGLCGWFDVNLCKGVSFSTSPSSKATHKDWRQVFFPIEREIRVKKDSVIKIDLMLKRSEEDLCACFDWSVTAACPNDGKQIIVIKHSTKKSFPFSREKICNKRKCDTEIDGKERNRQLAQAAKRISILNEISKSKKRDMQQASHKKTKKIFKTAKTRWSRRLKFADYL